MATQIWFGTTLTRSPTRHERLASLRLTYPCSSFIFSSTAAGSSGKCPKPETSATEQRSDENVFEPPSMIIWPGTEVETTVAMTVAAQSSSSHDPHIQVLRSLNI